jgi:hypothetical protein
MARNRRTVRHVPRTFGADERAHAPGGASQPSAREPCCGRCQQAAQTEGLDSADRSLGGRACFDEDQRRRACRACGGACVSSSSPQRPSEVSDAGGVRPGARGRPVPIDIRLVRSGMGAGHGPRSCSFGGPRNYRRLCGRCSTPASNGLGLAYRGGGRGGYRQSRNRRHRRTAPLRSGCFSIDRAEVVWPGQPHAIPRGHFRRGVGGSVRQCAWLRALGFCSGGSARRPHP